MSSAAGSKSLRLSRPDRCAVCELDLAAGERALWHKGLRVVTCVGCSLAPQEVVEGVAGASAQREYNRRHAQRQDRAREKLGGHGVLFARVIDEPQSTAAWKKGAEGEIRTAARLTMLLEGTGVRFLHDRRMPGSRSANIDHIAIGPGGITVIDTKNYRGKVRVERGGGLFSQRRELLKIGGRDKTALIDGVERQIAGVRTVLDDQAHEIEIRGALLFADIDGLPVLRHLTVRGMIVGGPRTTAKLASRPGPLTVVLVDALWRRLGASLQAA
jgi:nuclease-like protein